MHQGVAFNMSANLEDPAVATELKKSSFIPIPKKGSTKEYVNHQTTALISHASKVMLKILHARLQHYANQELPDVQTGFRKGRGTRDQIAKIRWIIEKTMEFQKNFYFCFIDYAIVFDCVHHNKLKHSSSDGNTRPPYLPSEKPVCKSRSNRTRHGTMDWFKTGKGVCQGYILSPCLFNLYAEYLMQNAGLDESQAGIRISGRNINNIRHVDDTILMAESEDEGEGGK